MSVHALPAIDVHGHYGRYIRAGDVPYGDATGTNRTRRLADTDKRLILRDNAVRVFGLKLLAESECQSEDS